MSWPLVVAATFLSITGGYHYGKWWQDRTKRLEFRVAVLSFTLSLLLLVVFWVTVWT